MGEFIFRMPRNTPQLSYWPLDEYLRGSANAGLRVRSGVPLRRKIGSTVEVREEVTRGTRRIALVLYSTTLAYFYSDDRVEFTEAGANDRHMATGYWLDEIAAGNGLGRVYRENWQRYLFTYSSAGRDREPIAGATFQGDPAAVAAVYRGWDGFLATYPATAHINVGSVMEPVTSPELCQCSATLSGERDRELHGQPATYVTQADRLDRNQCEHLAQRFTHDLAGEVHSYVVSAAPSYEQAQWFTHDLVADVKRRQAEIDREFPSDDPVFGPRVRSGTSFGGCSFVG